MNYTTALIQLPLVKESRRSRVRTPDDVSLLCADLRDLAQEAFHVLCLDTKNGLINRHLASLGIVDASLVHPREIFRCAITDNATAIVLVHNHPSGDPTPSAEDVRITRQLIEAGRILSIKVLDHVVIGRSQDGSPGQQSLRETGLCSFE
jgi:DNA repair protein RadC